jgi:hypothetical protein
VLTETLVHLSALRPHVRNGLQAFRATDLALIALAEKPRVGHSLDLDEATRVEHPNANRWDYLLCIPDLEKIVALEPHSAKDSEIKVVAAKRQWAVDFLRDHLPPGKRVSKWYWVTRGKIGFGKMERARRQIDQAGISFVGRMLQSF